MRQINSYCYKTQALKDKERHVESTSGWVLFVHACVQGLDVWGSYSVIIVVDVASAQASQETHKYREDQKSPTDDKGRNYVDSLSVIGPSNSMLEVEN